MPDIKDFKQKARQLRIDILETIANAGSGHPGGSLSCVEILISLYFYKLRPVPQNPAWADRDRFIMSKGHASAALYTTLASCGYFPKEELRNFRKLGSRLQGHVYAGVPGVEFSTGALGEGLSVANGMALGAKIRKKDFKVYCLLGDGEMQEGQVWEAAMTAAQHKLDNLCAIVDYNGVQQNGPVAQIKNEEPLAGKLRDFGWNTLDINGHDFDDIIKALDLSGKIKDKPTFIAARTIKGKGVSFMEGNPRWHGKAPNGDELSKALEEIKEKI
ncbi:MAG: transketolase [Omnitrophica WOR_2 bacterium RIFCSPLOWO2_02_FULL_50_19]|nr:MAG: transketolase [Omnitrophica WOR_2 bacterium RIFCSPLOWO2_02_FULL_50_19]